MVQAEASSLGGTLSTLDDGPAVLHGNAGKERILAALIDNALAIITAMILVNITPGEYAKAVALFVGYLGYFFLLEWRWSTTPGKRMFGLFVRTLDGQRCSLRGAVARTLLRIIEVNPILLGMIPGGLVIMKSRRNQRLGDMIGRVVVTSHNLDPALRAA